MARINGVEMPEPTGGTGGFTNALMGIFRDRTRAQRQLELMAYQSAMGVAAHVAKTKLGGEATTEAMKQHYETAFDESQWKSPQAREAFEANLRHAGVKRFGPSGFEAQATGNIPGTRKIEEKTAPVLPTAAEGDKLKASKKSQGAGRTRVTPPVVNEAPQTVAAPNIGARTPAPSKGGFKQPMLPGMSKAGKPSKPRIKKPGMGEIPTTGGMNA